MKIFIIFRSLFLTVHCKKREPWHHAIPMKKTRTIIIFLFILAHAAIGQTSNPESYKNAFAEQVQMLKGEKPINFKRAVFLTENVFYNGGLSYQEFCDSIASTGRKLKALIKQRGLEKYKTAPNWAVYTYMMDSTALNNYKPFTYDFTDFMGDEDWSKMFVTKLMKTRSGNCNSLPTYYKILCEEIGASASLALAPNHLYIKHIDEKGQWTNVELTNAGFPRDQWIIKELGISVEAIRQGTYMSPLSPKESIALTMLNLASAYQFQHGYDAFVLKVVNTALSYYPRCIPLLMTRANYYKSICLAEAKKPKPDQAVIDKNYGHYQENMKKIDQLGYKELPAELYEEWVQSVEKEKKKRAVVATK